MKPSKCPFKILSPIGDGALGGLAVPGASVLERLAFLGDGPTGGWTCGSPETVLVLSSGCPMPAIGDVGGDGAFGMDGSCGCTYKKQN